MIVAVAVAVLTLGVFMGWHEASRFASAKREALFATATAFSAAVGKGVAAGDAAAVRQGLRAIGQVPGAVHAEVYDRNGRLLADLGGAARLAGDLDLTEGSAAASAFGMLGAHTVRIATPVIDQGAVIGTLVLVSETGDLVGALANVLLGALGAGALALGVGLAISLQLQRAITRPLVALTRTMAEIRRSHDYDATIDVESDDETGALAASFNGMIAEIRERDGALLRHQEHLESEVEARTVDLSEAKRAAETANDAKSSFLATMSHEIRTPMNGMLVMAELLATSNLPTRERRYAEVIARSGQSLVAIINDILDLSKVEAGKLELEQAPVVLAEIVDTVVALFGERAQGKSVDLAAHVALDAPEEVCGDPVRITQILSNLVNNALKFTERGHVLVRVARSGGAVRFDVADTGIGIPADKLDTIFASFSQADQSTARRFGGTGLGLSICKKLVEAMGGAIAVASEVGVGSTFSVTLPLETTRPAAEIDRAAPGRPAIRVATSGGATSLALLASLDEAGFERASPADHGPAVWIMDAAALLRDARRPQGAVSVVAVAAAGDDCGDQAIARGLADRLLGWPVAQAEWRPLLTELGTGKLAPASRISSNKRVAVVATFANVRVLVADDSPVNREVACEALRRFGVAAETVEDGRAAVMAVRENAFDLVLMDGSMPELDGFAAARLIRAHEAETGRRRTPIVALTAHVLGDQADAWIAAGMDDILHKPLSVAKLESCLRRWIGEETHASVAPPPAEPPADADEQSLLDEETLGQLEQMAEMSGGDFLARVFGLFDGQAGQTLDGLEQAAKQRESGAAASLAHSLNSISLNIGARALAARLAGIEKAARDESELPSEDELGLLRRLFVETSAALAARWRAPSGAGRRDAA